MMSAKIHSQKLCDFAIYDILATVAVSLIISLFVKVLSCPILNFVVLSLVMFGIATFTHWYMGIPTKFGALIGINDYKSVVNYRKNPNYGLLPVAKDVTMWIATP